MEDDSELSVEKSRSKMKKSSSRSSSRLKCKVSENEIVGGLSEKEKEIVCHYLNGLKYGMPGSDGTMWSNYVCFMSNNNEFLSIFLADKLNPYTGVNRFLKLWSTCTLYIFLSAVFILLPEFENASLVQGGSIALLLAPYTYIIDQCATCNVFHRANCCIRCSHVIGNVLIYCSVIAGCVYMIGGMYILYNKKVNMGRYFATLFISLLLAKLMPFYFGIWNWIVVSWEGFLFLPILRWGCNGKYVDFPMRWYPLLSCIGIQMVLNMYELGYSSYEDDKAIFQKKYPKRISIDDFTTSDVVIVNDANENIGNGEIL